jgi:hypothetical protein
MGAPYRIRQFIRAVGARVTPAEWAWAGERLPPAALELFRALPRQDQRHALDVAHALVESGLTDPELLAAALLHDCGKAGAGLTVWHRSIIVLLHRLRPDWLEWLGARDAGWRRPFWAHLHHPEIGAARAEAAGCAALTVWIIRWHHRPAETLPADSRRDALLALQRRDDTT